jgi:hypothetical protein
LPVTLCNRKGEEEVMKKTCKEAVILAGIILTALSLSTLDHAQSTPASLGKGEVSLLEPRRIAAAIVAAALPAPKRIVNVGARQGEFLEIFLDQFPNAYGQWTEPKESIDNRNIDIAKLRLARFGDRVSYVIGGYGRDISDGSVPKDADVIVTDWMSINQSLDGMYKIYRIAAEQLPHGGWLVNLDHVGFGGSGWESRLQSGAKAFRPNQEGPKTKFAEIRVPTADEQLGAMRAAGLNAKVVWQSFNLVLFMARKP